MMETREALKILRACQNAAASAIQTIGRVCDWLCEGQPGHSSMVMALRCLGVVLDDQDHPRDPHDLWRCLLLLEAVPELRDHMNLCAEISPEWKALVDRWDEIEKTFVDEAGLKWSGALAAPKTYELMRQILKEVSQ